MCRVYESLIGILSVSYAMGVQCREASNETIGVVNRKRDGRKMFSDRDSSQRSLRGLMPVPGFQEHRGRRRRLGHGACHISAQLFLGLLEREIGTHDD